MNGMHVLVSGRVQGVGFRWWMRRKATSLGLVGWVRNLADGRVEARFAGERDAVEAMRVAISRGPASARVDEVIERRCEAGTNWEGFTIADTASEEDHA